MIYIYNGIYIYTFNYIYNDTRYYWISCIYVEAAPNLRSDQELENHRRTIPPIHIKTQIHRYPSPRNDPYLFWSDRSKVGKAKRSQAKFWIEIQKIR